MKCPQCRQSFSGKLCSCSNRRPTRPSRMLSIAIGFMFYLILLAAGLTFGLHPQKQTDPVNFLSSNRDDSLKKSDVLNQEESKIIDKPKVGKPIQKKNARRFAKPIVDEN